MVTPRALWQLFEPLHAVTYFAEESVQASADLGLPGFWLGYVAFRAAPLGPVDAPGSRRPSAEPGGSRTVARTYGSLPDRPR